MLIKLILSLVLINSLFADLEQLNLRVDQDLDWTGYPENWLDSTEDILDVAIIGAGMAGMSAAFALKKVGIHHLQLFDQNAEGKEGPWATAHMLILRTGKCAQGPSLGFPSLTFQAWYEAKFGKEAWNDILKATPQEWLEYLYWFRKILELPVTNECRLINIHPLSSKLFELEFEKKGTSYKVLARKVVLATGRSGFGGAYIPTFMQSVLRNLYYHTSDHIDYSQFKNKHIVIVGCGASAFDAAGASLEAGAKKVELLFRRKEIPVQNKLSLFVHSGLEQGFHLLSDELRWKLLMLAHSGGTPPPLEALERVKLFPQFELKPATKILQVNVDNNATYLDTNQGVIQCDHLILATGYHIGGSQLPELKNIMSNISLWKQHISAPQEELNLLGDFPYLGAAYEFIESEIGKAPFLKNIYCFNYAALLSHGLTTNAIDSMSVGAERLARGIAADFFKENINIFIETLDNQLN